MTSNSFALLAEEEEEVADKTNLKSASNSKSTSISTSTSTSTSTSSSSSLPSSGFLPFPHTASIDEISIDDIDAELDVVHQEQTFAGMVNGKRKRMKRQSKKQKKQHKLVADALSQQHEKAAPAHKTETSKKRKISEAVTVEVKQNGKETSTSSTSISTSISTSDSASLLDEFNDGDESVSENEGSEEEENENDTASSSFGATEAENATLSPLDQSLFPASDLAATLRVLTHLSSHLDVFYSPFFRSIRSAMNPIVKTQILRYKYEKRKADRRETRRGRRTLKNADEERIRRERELDKDHRNQTEMRARRLRKLEELEKIQDGETDLEGEGGKGGRRARLLMRVPDGCADGWDGNNQSMEGILRIEHKAEKPSSNLSSSTGNHSLSSSSSSKPSSRTFEVSDEVEEKENSSTSSSLPRELHNSIKCYICKRSYKQLHHFYDSLCPSCASFNYLKRNLTCDLTNRIALVTGARVKIGYRILLKLLRAGATCIATTRFSIDLSIRLSREQDYKEWNERIHIVGIDFRDIQAVESFCAYLYTKFSHLDMIINNACQTVRRPPAFYSHLVERERVDYDKLNEKTKQMLQLNLSFQMQHQQTLGHNQGTNQLKLQGAAERIVSTGTVSNGKGNGTKVEEMTDGNESMETTAEVVEEIGVKSNPITNSTSASSSAASTASKPSSKPSIIPSRSSSSSSHSVPPSISTVTSAPTSSSSSSSPLVNAGARSPAIAERFAQNKRQSRRQAMAQQKRKAEEAAARAQEVATNQTTSSTAIATSLTTTSSSLFVPSSSISSSLTSISSDSTQLTVLRDDHMNDPSLFPVSRTDVNGQQLDLRTENSWMLKLADVSTGEMAEVMAINLMTPFILNARLKALMVKSPFEWRFIVNVSAMEGKFYRYKSDRHPHSNMMKAGLNMMTRTSASDYKQDGIFMTAVDTGWINLEQPHHIAVRMVNESNFQTPLDEIDAASRVLDPIFAPLAEKQKSPEKEIVPPYGFFIKDYEKCEW